MVGVIRHRWLRWRSCWYINYVCVCLRIRLALCSVALKFTMISFFYNKFILFCSNSFFNLGIVSIIICFMLNTLDTVKIIEQFISHSRHFFWLLCFLMLLMLFELLTKWCIILWSSLWNIIIILTKNQILFNTSAFIH